MCASWFRGPSVVFLLVFTFKPTPQDSTNPQKQWWFFWSYFKQEPQNQWLFFWLYFKQRPKPGGKNPSKTRPSAGGSASASLRPPLRAAFVSQVGAVYGPGGRHARGGGFPAPRGLASVASVPGSGLRLGADAATSHGSFCTKLGLSLLWMDEILHHLRNPGMMIPL